jgi:aspartyl-tRNA synthetase
VGGHDIPRPFERITYADAMSRFGTDKPDLRFGLELADVTAAFAGTSFRVFQSPYVGAIRMPGGASQTRRQLDGWQDWAKARGARGLAYLVIQPDGSMTGPVGKNLSEDERAAAAAATGAQPGDCLFFAAGEPGAAQSLLGAARLEIGERLDLIDPDAWSFVWVVDAPMFEWDHDDARWNAVHHPFTAPAPAWADRFVDEPGEALAAAYDVVCNGNELGGGSLRIHQAGMQEQVFGILGISGEEAREKFGFLLEAFRYGPPPHGGIAFGWDRICMLLAGADSLRDVIAFPKTGGGYDPLTSAPTPITATQRSEAGIDVTPQDAEDAVPGNAPRHAVIADERRN